jgi:hypothetical protein
MFRCLLAHHRETVPQIESSGVEPLQVLCLRPYSRKKTKEQRSMNDGKHSDRSTDSERLRKVSWQGSLRHMRAEYTKALFPLPTKSVPRLAMMVPIFQLRGLPLPPKLRPSFQC